MIIEGLILTNKGPVAVADLKVGDMVLSHLYRAKPVTEITKHPVSEGYAFKKNSTLVVTKGTLIKTAYGDRKVEKLTTPTYIPQPDGRQIKDSATRKKAEMYAYDIKFAETTSIFVSNYPIQIEV